jgi:hypothetical protein
MGHAHVARPSRLQQPTIRERPEPASCDMSVKDSVKRSVFLCSKKISSAPRLNSANRGVRVVSWRDETRRASEEEEEERMCGTFLLTHLSSGATPHLICWSTSLQTFHVGLNLAPTSCLCAAKNLGCMSHGLTHKGFEISRNLWNLLWATRFGPNISTISHQISNAHLEICQTSLFVYIPVFQQRLLSWTST